MLNRKIIIPLLAIALLFAFSAAALATSYVGASTTGKFHYTDCRWAKKIRTDHRVEFGSRDEAVAAGYVPCGVCRP